MNGVLTSLLADYSPPLEPTSGIAILRKVKLETKAEPELNPTPKPNPVDQQAELLREVEAKARREEREQAQQRLEEAVAAERKRHEEELKAERVIWTEQEGLQISQQFVEAFSNLERIVSDRVANILNSFVSEALRQQTIADFELALRTMLSGTPSRLIKVTGPKDILSMIESNLGPLAGSIEFVPSEAVEVKALSQDTTIESQLEVWSIRLADVLKVGF